MTGGHYTLIRYIAQNHALYFRSPITALDHFSSTDLSSGDQHSAACIPSATRVAANEKVSSY
ncbi:hypothetical protein M404DRAFT_991295 [Pisolithus tinctorius Marx 270]|uniref:Uncharacterized protein n=1 Tax=Pisolithus tinctorius Marx 270 TaxID=870435 RepID=A0A0C3JZF1_PISTI|nr:hypothetical protein M404DRAFT_991295 [Pisolithus tinctorius Marx 270]